MEQKGPPVSRYSVGHPKIAPVKFSRRSRSAGNRQMTVGVALCCKDGIVLASDSLSTFSRGAPVARFTNKVYIVEHKELLHPIAIAGAGMTAFIDKFADRVRRTGIESAQKTVRRKLDIVDFVERVAETVVSIMLKEYAIDRNQFFGTPISEFGLSMLVAGATAEHAEAPAELRAYNIHSIGLAEQVEGYGTIGSGAAYAELFLHGFVPEPQKLSVKDAIRLVCYTIKGVEVMDPNVGGETRVCALQWGNPDKDGKKQLLVKRQETKSLPTGAKDRMESVLNKIGTDMRKIVGK
ncbi:MAG: hypothetical protein WBD95_19400 [Xanthobacteraceae bacterium]